MTNRRSGCDPCSPFQEIAHAKGPRCPAIIVILVEMKDGLAGTSKGSGDDGLGESCAEEDGVKDGCVERVGVGHEGV